MKRFIKNFYIYFLFIISQTIFLFSDYIYVNAKEPFSVHVSLLFITLIITVLSLTIRTVFEAFYLTIVSKIAKNSMGLRDIAKTMFKSMIYPCLLAVVFLLIQLIFIRNTAEIYQTIASSIINLTYMIFVCINIYKKHSGKAPIIAFAIYTIAYVVMQGYSIFSLI